MIFATLTARSGRQPEEADAAIVRVFPLFSSLVLGVPSLKTFKHGQKQSKKQARCTRLMVNCIDAGVLVCCALDGR